MDGYVLLLHMRIDDSEWVERAEGPVPSLEDAQRIAAELSALEAEEADEEIGFRWSVVPYSAVYADATPLPQAGTTRST